MRVPGPDATWSALHEFAQTYDAALFLSGSMGRVAQLAYRPVFEATENGTLTSADLGIDLLRAALAFQSRSDSMSGAHDFSGPEVETLYRAVCAELHRRTGGWVDEQR